MNMNPGFTMVWFLLGAVIIVVIHEALLALFFLIPLYCIFAVRNAWEKLTRMIARLA